MDALSIASSGLSANQAWITTISNNIANMQTNAFKRSEVSFADLVQPLPGHDGYAADAGTEAFNSVGAGVQASAATLMFSQGAMSVSANPLDIAIEGKGFFEVTLASGELAYTRAGRFHVNANGQLALLDNQVLNADVRIPPDAQQVLISADGEVNVRLASTPELLNVGHLRLANFAYANGLQARGDGLYSATVRSGEVTYGEPGRGAQGSLLAAHVERSNVDMNTEMADLMLAQRAYQLNARVLQASDQILESINNLRRW